MDKETLCTEDIFEAISPNLKRYEEMSWLEQFAMYMGKAQILELGLKNLLSDEFDVEFDVMQRWTLGRIIKELRERGCRKDFLAFLDIVKNDRNYIAHEYLANNAMVFNLLKVNECHLTQKELVNPVIHLEQAIFIFDWTNKYGEWHKGLVK